MPSSGRKKRRVAPLVPAGKFFVAPGVPGGRPVTSLTHARKLTSKFHTLLNTESATERALTEAQAAGNAAGVSAAKAKLEEVRKELAKMGGRETYQAASALATSAFRSSRVVFKTLVREGLQPRRGETPIRVLEIGAVNAQLVVCPWMRVRAIDITSRDKKYIEEIDFFNIPVRDAVAGEYDVVVNAMVLNCVPDSWKRAEMLIRCHDHLKPGGLMFFALPSRCLDMSEYITRPMFEDLLVACGFVIRSDHRTPKISFYVLQRCDGCASAEAGAIASAFPPRERKPAGPTSVSDAATSSIDSKPQAVAAGMKRGRPADERVAAAARASAAAGTESDDGAVSEAGSTVTHRTADPAVRDAVVSVAAKYACTRTAAGAWRPVIHLQSVRDTARRAQCGATLKRLAPPPKQLPKAELPVTGFSRTDFSISIRPDVLMNK